MDPCRYGSSCWRPLCPCVHVDGQSYGHGSRQRKKRTRSIVDVPGPQIEADDLPVPQVMKENFEEFKLPQERVVELAESPGEAQSSWSRASATTAAAAVATKVAKSVCEGEARPCGIAKYGATAESYAEKSGGAGPSWSGARGTTSADVTAVARTVGEAQPPEFAKYSATSDSESDLAERLLMKSLLMKLSLFCPDEVARPVPSLQQPRSVLVKIGLLRSQRAVPRKVQCRDQCPWTRSLSC